MWMDCRERSKADEKRTAIRGNNSSACRTGYMPGRQLPGWATNQRISCLKIHAPNLHTSTLCESCIKISRRSPLRLLLLVQIPSDCDVHLAERNFQTRSKADLKVYFQTFLLNLNGYYFSTFSAGSAFCPPPQGTVRRGAAGLPRSLGPCAVPASLSHSRQTDRRAS